jgi:hypothetical protein
LLARRGRLATIGIENRGSTVTVATAEAGKSAVPDPVLLPLVPPAPGFAGFTFPRFRPWLEKADDWTVAIGAGVEEVPAGLALARTGDDPMAEGGWKARLLSLMVAGPYRLDRARKRAHAIPTPSGSPQAARSEPQNASGSSSHTGSAGRSASARPDPPAMLPVQLPLPRARIMCPRVNGEFARIR